MSDDIGNVGPPPAWLSKSFLQQGERVVVWGGPREMRFLAWFKDRALLLLCASFLAGPLLMLAGAGLDMHLGWADAQIGRVLGGCLWVAGFGATLALVNSADKDVFHVLTDRRFLVIKRLMLVQAFELDHMRRLLAAVDALRPSAVPREEHILDPSKVRPLLPPASAGVTDMGPILRMLRTFGQLQAKP